MTATLRVVLNDLGVSEDSASALVTHQVAQALIATAPEDCEVSGLVSVRRAQEVATILPGLAGVNTVPFSPETVARSWQMGVVTGVGGGLIHAPTLTAPLVRHDRVYDGDQTVVSVWDLTPWDQPELLPKLTVSWQKAMLKRAQRYADAIVVPTHSMAIRLGEIAPRLSERLRVIEGAAPEGFVEPSDAVGRRRALRAPEGAIVVVAGMGLEAGLRAVSSRDEPVIVIGATKEEAAGDIAASGIDPERVRAVRAASHADRASLLSSSVALVAPSTARVFPWRVLEALALGIPVLAAESPEHEEIIADAGVLVATAELSDGLEKVFDSRHEYGVRSADRGRSFSWSQHGSALWALHADL